MIPRDYKVKKCKKCELLYLTKHIGSECCMKCDSGRIVYSKLNIEFKIKRGEKMICPYCGVDLVENEDGTYSCETCDILFHWNNDINILVANINDEKTKKSLKTKLQFQKNYYL